MKCCSVENCIKPHYARGWCIAHYMRWRSTGYPTVIIDFRHKEVRRKDHPLYNTWVLMKQRCLNPQCPSYKYYGERGIKVCDDWLNFDTFVRDVGSRPAGRTLDRTDNNGPYAASNFRWATRSEQMLNTRRAVR